MAITATGKIADGDMGRKGGKGSGVGGGYPGDSADDETAGHPSSSAASSLIEGSLRSTTLAASFPDSSSDGSAASRIRPISFSIRDLDWDRIWLGSVLYPYRGYAHCAEDIHLLACFLRIADVSAVDGDSVKLLFRTLKFMRLCDYTAEDICSILAHASSYFIDTWQLCGSQMDASEVGNVMSTLIFIAHCYVQDETCPLHIWHKHLFRKYCPLKTLNAAVIRLLQIRRYLLRLSDEELTQRYDRLMLVLQRFRTGSLAYDAGGVPSDRLPQVGSGATPTHGSADAAVGAAGGGGRAATYQSVHDPVAMPVA